MASASPSGKSGVSGTPHLLQLVFVGVVLLLVFPTPTPATPIDLTSVISLLADNVIDWSIPQLKHSTEGGYKEPDETGRGQGPGDQGGGWGMALTTRPLLIVPGHIHHTCSATTTTTTPAAPHTQIHNRTRSLRVLHVSSLPDTLRALAKQ
ncbi:putative anti-lipopolysaccharide factor-like 7 [Homarus americanus]|uniref:Putative anti-lipopolysaccharide factor-like 7 n=1 Tax=Homarus americanus TaxID=6706 RepID=A0A8J5JZ35_HOMAM|nr:putative anti-lipopolysaccharide factor-like 7 [Homarus americanus]